MIMFLSKKMLNAMSLDSASYPKGFAVYGDGNIEVHIGIWILTGVLYGALDVNGAEMAAWDDKSSAASKRKSFKHVCHKVGVSGEMPTDIKANFISLYEHYESIAQYDDDFYIEPMCNHWIIKSGQFDRSWCVDRYINSERAHPDHNAINMSQAKIISLADDDLSSAMELMMLGLEEADKIDGAFIFLARGMAPQILSKALSSCDKEIIAKAEKYRDELGFMGFSDLDERINELQ